MSRLRHIKIGLCDHQTNLSELEQGLTKSVSQFSCHSLCFHLSHPLCVVLWQEPRKVRRGNGEMPFLKFCAFKPCLFMVLAVVAVPALSFFLSIPKVEHIDMKEKA